MCGKPCISTAASTCSESPGRIARDQTPPPIFGWCRRSSLGSDPAATLRLAPEIIARDQTSPPVFGWRRKSSLGSDPAVKLWLPPVAHHQGQTSLPQKHERRQVCSAYTSAMVSISQSAPLGRSFTATQERAGFDTKYFA